MPVLRNMTIRHKLILIIMLTCIAALVLAGAIAIAGEWTSLRQNMVRNLSIHAQMTAENCQAALKFDDPEDANDVLRALHVDSSIIFACIQNKNGEVLANYYRDKTVSRTLPADCKLGASEMPEGRHSFRNGLLTVLKPVVLDDEIIGRVCLQLDLQPMYEMLRRNVEIIIAVVLIVSLIAYLVSLRLQRIISGPILSLANIAKTVSEKKKYSTRAVKQTNDEVGLLINAFNEMLEQIQKRDSKLVDAKEHLEVEVQNRTSELSSTNNKLQRHIKQLNCFYGLSKLIEQPKISLEEIFQKTVPLICNAFQHPDKICVRIAFEGINYQTDNFKKTELSQYAQINIRGDKAGAIEVYYLGEKTENGESPFLEEEHNLLDAIAEHLGRIAARRQTTKKLELLRNLIDRSNDCIFIIEPKWGRFLDANDKAYASLGYAREELLNMALKDIDDPIRDDSYWTERFKEIREKGYMIFESVYKRKDSTTFPVEINVSFIEQEKKGYLIAVVRDITERKKIEAALQKSEEKYRRQFEEAMDAIFIADAETGVIIDCNDAAAALVGREKTELIGKHQRILHPPEEIKEGFSRTFKEHLGEEEGQALESKVITKNGEIRDVSIKANLLEVKGKKLMQGIFRDVTERKRAEERQAQLIQELERTNQEVENINQELKDFAYIVSHDLKAPLRGIKTLAQWMSTDYADKFDETGREQIDLLLKRVQRMHNLIDGVLQYSRIGRMKEELVQVNLNKLVPTVIDMIAPPENITITVENELPTVECEETRIMQVFQNLLSNAVKYMDKPKGQIKIGCIEEHGFWKFSVADNGPGIEEKHFERIFKIFQTLTPRDEFESTGIGLTVIKKIVELYDGKIWVESKPGEGSTFFFTLPKQKMEVEDAKLQTNIIGRR